MSGIGDTLEMYAASSAKGSCACSWQHYVRVADDTCSRYMWRTFGTSMPRYLSLTAQTPTKLQIMQNCANALQPAYVATATSLTGIEQCTSMYTSNYCICSILHRCAECISSHRLLTLSKHRICRSIRYRGPGQDADKLCRVGFGNTP